MTKHSSRAWLAATESFSDIRLALSSMTACSITSKHEETLKLRLAGSVTLNLQASSELPLHQVMSRCKLCCRSSYECAALSTARLRLEASGSYPDFSRVVMFAHMLHCSTARPSMVNIPKTLSCKCQTVFLTAGIPSSLH